MGKCYWASEVNYILWGFLNAKCHEYLRKEVFDVRVRQNILPGMACARIDGLDMDDFNLDTANGFVEAFRTAAHFDRVNEQGNPPRREAGLGIKGRVSWTEIGWNFGLSGANLESLMKSQNPPNPTRTCGKCQEKYSGSLTAKAGNTENIRGVTMRKGGSIYHVNVPCWK